MAAFAAAVPSGFSLAISECQLADQHPARDPEKLIATSDRERRSLGDHRTAAEHVIDVGTQLVILPGVVPVHLAPVALVCSGPWSRTNDRPIRRTQLEIFLAITRLILASDTAAPLV